MEGFGRFTFEICSRLVKLYPQHTFYFFFDRPYDKKFIFAENVVPIVLYPPARHPILFKIWFNWSITRALKKHAIDIFFSPDGYLSLKTDVPQVGVIHDLNFEHFPEDIPAVPRRYLKTHFPLFAQKAKHIITVSEFSKQDIVDLYGINAHNITVAFNAANAVFKPQNEAVKREVRAEFSGGASFFVYVGAIHARKNISRLLEAFKAFKVKTSSDTRLLIVGEALWNDEEIGDRHPHVLFTGHVNIEKLAIIVGSAKALCLVSYFEGFGIPIVEAMQSGVPVLAGNLTALPEVCGDAGMTVDPFDINEISEAMTMIDQDSDKRQKMIAAGFDQVKKFSWEKSAEIIGGVLENNI
ncbi:MAG: glycosyltransferase family 1 protein [Putridiphycobacter sp.]|nr:glycosyltransferase family 1 protein [Putridiphycobacter sp.]